MNTQPEVLQLADEMDADGFPEAAAELRRLHAENEARTVQRDEARRTVREAHEAGTRLHAQRDALLEALRDIAEFSLEQPTKAVARAAIATVEGEKA